MGVRIIDSNKFLKNENDFLMKIAKSTVASFKLEGITISFEEALKIAKDSASKVIIDKK